MAERVYLNRGDAIRMRADDAAPITFNIVRRIGDGASCVSYVAFHSATGLGVLKEFYPDTTLVTRSSDGQLCPVSIEAGDTCRAAEAEYVRPYEQFMEDQRHGQNERLATFIPQFSIYRGCAADGTTTGTAYVWTAQPELETFDRFCERLHERPEERAGERLYRTLSAIRMLAGCVMTLHEEGFLHRDIKPSNLGFKRDWSGDILPETLQLFDIDTMCRRPCADGIVGTPDYLDPQVASGFRMQDEAADLYAVGATLFHAIVITEETRSHQYLYQAGYAARLETMVAESALTQAYKGADRKRLIRLLAQILRRCLCEDSNRYRSGNELYDALGEALLLCMPSASVTIDVADADEGWSDAEENTYIDAYWALQYHLYQYPLYQYCDQYPLYQYCEREERKRQILRILVIGSASYVEPFLDVCLQNGQMKEYQLEVVALLTTDGGKEAYLQSRPELQRFFVIDGAPVDDARDDASYGSLRFVHIDIDVHDGQALEQLLGQYAVIDGAHYIYIALGDDTQSYKAADRCKSLLQNAGKKASVNYVMENREPVRRRDNVLHPFYIRQDVREFENYTEIERMAWNMHLIWEKNLCVDYESVKNAFRDPYNHGSCVSGVLSMKYKLHSLGIPLTERRLDDVAQLFTLSTLPPLGADNCNHLIWIEHRRWVTEKLCNGWRGIDDLSDCRYGVTKDGKNKRHVCIVRSRPDQMLAGYPLDWWDIATDEELSWLDDLDRMSVALHRMYEDNAATCMLDLQNGELVTCIRSYIAGNEQVMCKYDAWLDCMKRIMDGDTGEVRLYKSYVAAFRNSLDAVPEVKSTVCGLIDGLERLFYPIRGRVEYHDWKQEDVAIIRNIPFILTYTENLCMIIPYMVGDRVAEFDNVAAATMANPSRILYLYDIGDQPDLRQLCQSVSRTAEYMRHQNIRADIELILLSTSSDIQLRSGRIAKDIKAYSAGVFSHVTLLTAESMELLLDALQDNLAEQCAEFAYSASARNDTPLSDVLEQSGFYDAWGEYRFDADRMQFSEVVGCDMLRYINKKPPVSAADMPE